MTLKIINELWEMKNPNTILTIQKNDLHETYIVNINHKYTGHFITSLCATPLTDIKLDEFLNNIYSIFTKI